MLGASPISFTVTIDRLFCLKWDGLDVPSLGANVAVPLPECK